MATHSSTLAWKNPMDGGAWWAAVHGVAKSRTWLRDSTEGEMWYVKNVYYRTYVLQQKMVSYKAKQYSWPGAGEGSGVVHRGRAGWSRSACRETEDTPRYTCQHPWNVHHEHHAHANSGVQGPAGQWTSSVWPCDGGHASLHTCQHPQNAQHDAPSTRKQWGLVNKEGSALVHHLEHMYHTNAQCK